MYLKVMFTNVDDIFNLFFKLLNVFIDIIRVLEIL